MNKKDHFWIPDSEVVRLEKVPRGRSKPRDISYVEHGQKLSGNLDLIIETVNKFSANDSLRELDTLIYEVKLPEGEKIKDRDILFRSNGMSVKAVKTENEAIVSTTKCQFEDLRKRVSTYSKTGQYKTHFDYIDDFKPFVGPEKNSVQLQKDLEIDKAPEKIDINFMLVPNLTDEEYFSIIKLLLNKINRDNGEVINSEFRLSDNTPLVRAVVPSSAIKNYECDSAIYRIEETDFFSSISAENTYEDLDDFSLDDKTDLQDLEVVAVLDAGVKFPESLQSIVIETWRDDHTNSVNFIHGTKVASRVAFGYISDQLKYGNTLSPRARIIDCQIMDGNVPLDTLITRLQKAVEKYHQLCKIYNLSVNTQTPIEGNRMSILGYEIDALQTKYKVQFVISAGNHSLWQCEDTLLDIIDDDDSRISAPADSMMGISVGSIVNHTQDNLLTKANDIASYSRRGPGFNGFIKPDLVAYCSEMNNHSKCVLEDESMLLLDHNGKLSYEAGTSFAAPVISGDLAEILSKIPGRDILLAKALLLHHAKPIWDEEDLDEDQLCFAQNLYGRGLPFVEDSLYSSPHTVSFMRRGTLNKRTKERVKIYMPELLAAQSGRNIAKVSVTCITLPEVDQSKGTEYLGAYIRASLKKNGSEEDSLLSVTPDFKQGRRKWDTIQQFTKLFSSFNSGDWQIWLELFSRWEFQEEDVEYALIVTIEDMSHSLDIYNEIEIQHRYRPMSEVRVRI